MSKLTNGELSVVGARGNGGFSVRNGDLSELREAFSPTNVDSILKKVEASEDFEDIVRLRIQAQTARDWFRKLNRNRQEKVLDMNRAARADILLGWLQGKWLSKNIIKGRPRKTLPDGSIQFDRLTLDDINTTQNQSFRLQRLATLDREKELERYFSVQNAEFRPIKMSYLLAVAERGAKGNVYRSDRKAPALGFVHGSNAELMLQVERVYFESWHRQKQVNGEKLRIADITFHEGKMWEMINTDKYEFFKSDKSRKYRVAQMNCRNLRYENDSKDVVVFDPPYVPFVRKNSPGVSGDYNSDETTPNWTPKQIRGLFEAGMKSAYRVLSPGGLLLVKCQDQTVHHKKWQQTREVFDIAIRLGFAHRDTGGLVQTGTGRTHSHRQQFLRCNWSVLWIFEK